MPNQDDQKKKPSGPPHVSDLILGSLKPRTGKETSKWIAGLADNSVKDAVEAAARDIETNSLANSSGSLQPLPRTTPQAVIGFTDQIFDQFQQYEYDFNRSVAGTDYVISIERPTFSNEHVRIKFQAPETVKVFRGRLSTRYWTLIIRACNEIIEGWIMPVEQLFAFRADDEMYCPIISIEPKASRSGELAWRVNKVEVGADQVRPIAKQLFGMLIRVARGEAASDEIFCLPDKPDMRSTGELPKEQIQMTPPPSLSNSSPSLQKLDLTGPRQALQTGSQALQTPAQKSPKQTLRSSQVRSTGKNSTLRDGNQPQPTIEQVMAMLDQAVAKTLEDLSAQGAAAFSKQDLTTVEAIFRRTKAVKDLHMQMGQSIEHWKKALDEALKS